MRRPTIAGLAPPSPAPSIARGRAVPGGAAADPRVLGRPTSFEPSAIRGAVPRQVAASVRTRCVLRRLQFSAEDATRSDSIPVRDCGIRGHAAQLPSTPDTVGYACRRIERISPLSSSGSALAPCCLAHCHNARSRSPIVAAIQSGRGSWMHHRRSGNAPSMRRSKNRHGARGPPYALAHRPSFSPPRAASTRVSIVGVRCRPTRPVSAPTRSRMKPIPQDGILQTSHYEICAPNRSRARTKLVLGKH